MVCIELRTHIKRAAIAVVVTQILVNGLSRGCLYALSAFGFGLVFNSTKTLHVLHGAVFTASGYILYWSLNAGILFPVSFLLSLLCAAFLGLLSETFLYGPLRRAGASSKAAFVASLGGFVLLVNLIALAWGSAGRTIKSPVDGVVTLSGLVVSNVQVSQVALLLLLVAAYPFLLLSPVGRSLRALRDAPLLFEALGFDLHKARLLVLALGSLLAGLAGVLSALDVGVEPYGGFTMLLYSAAATIVGGVGVFHGAVIGGIMLGLLQAIVSLYLSSGWEEASVLLAMAVFLLIRPQGIFGLRQRAEER